MGLTLSTEEHKKWGIPEWCVCTSNDLRDIRWYTKCHLHNNKCGCHIVFYKQNSEANFAFHHNGFFSTFELAWEAHQCVVCAPDDIWMAICMNFSSYVNGNSSELRKIFVRHRGQVPLSLYKFSEWHELFAEMINMIKPLMTNGDICDILESNFSTTGRTEKLMSHFIIMDSFKEYFAYSKFVPEEESAVVYEKDSVSNDIDLRHKKRDVKFMGGVDDWKLLVNKLKLLRSFTLDKPDDPFKSYVDNLMPILEKFIEMVLGTNTDLEFWKNIISMRQDFQSRSCVRASGWIIKFFGNGNGPDIDLYDVPRGRIAFPIKSNDKILTVYGGFGRTTMSSGALRPQQYMVIYHDTHDQ